MNKNLIKNEKGFSLIELTIVGLVIAIMITASIPSITRTLRLYRLESAIGLLSNRLSEAKITAIKRNQNASLRVNTTNRTLEVLDASGNPISTTVVVPLPQDVSIASGSVTSVTFNSLGRNQSNSTTIIKFNISNPSSCKAMTISAVGRISLSGC